MKTTPIAPLALLIATACSGGSDTKAPAGEPAGAAAEAKPHTHTAENAHSAPMDMASTTPQPGDSAATRGYKEAMARMMDGAPPYTGDADIDFNKQMRIHHIAAIDMAEVHLANGKDEGSKALARKIIADQKREVAQIDAWLQQRGQ